jgi:hypothetical protein
MAANIEEQLIEKVRALPPDKLKKLLEYAEDLARPQNGGVSSVKKPTIWEMVEDIIREGRGRVGRSAQGWFAQRRPLSLRASKREE